MNVRTLLNVVGQMKMGIVELEGSRLGRGRTRPPSDATTISATNVKAHMVYWTSWRIEVMVNLPVRAHLANRASLRH